MSVTGGPRPSTVPFKNLNSFNFDGVDDYFLGTSTYSELDGETKMTFSCWIKPTNATTSVIVSIKDSGITEQFRVIFHSSRYIVIRTYTGNGRDTRTANSSITLNVWTHISFCLDFALSSGSRGKIFINGVDATSADSMNQTSINTSGGGLRIGARDVSSLLPFTGLIDEVAIWSGTDLRNDVATIYNNGEPTDLNNNGLTAPTTWQRMGDLSTWNGTSWIMRDVNGGYVNRSINMVEANRTTDVPPNPFVNTKSISLDGVDDFVSVPNSTSLQFAESMSVSAWFKTSDNGGQMVIAGRGHIYSTTLSSWVLFRRTNNGIGVQLRSGNAFQYVLSTSNTYNDGLWHHVIFTRNISSGNLKLYIDGLLQNTTSGVTSDLNNVTQNTTIGADTQSAEYFLGNIDEVSIFNSELSASDVTSIYNSGVPNDISSLSPLSWWRCGDGDTSPTLTDNGSGGNDGTMTNFTTFSTDVPPTFSKRSIVLDGVDDLVSMGNVLNMANDGTDAYSISAWIKTTSTTSFQVIVAKQNSGSPFNGFNFYITNGTRLNFSLGTVPSAYINGRTNTISSLNNGSWHHVVLTYDGSQDVSGFSIYVDEVSYPVVSVVNTTPNDVSNTQDFLIGARGTIGSPALFFVGGIDEVSYFNSELSQSNVTSIYNSGVPNDIASLSPLSWWRCGDGDTSPTLTDNGSASNDGTMTNFTTFSTDVPT